MKPCSAKGKKNSLNAIANAKIVDFAGWDMPLHYGSQLQEHHYVRRQAGVFDVSHMTIVDLKGVDVAAYLRYLVANNIDRLVPGKALYTCMLNEQGGVIDDLIIYKISDDFYRLVVNSATHDKDLAWLQKQAKNFQLKIEERTDYAMLAIQGPQVREKMSDYLLEHAKCLDLALRSGYDGSLLPVRVNREDGFEIILS